MRWRLVAACALCVPILAFASTTVGASDDEARGSCSGGPSDWRLRVRPEDGVELRVRFEIRGGEPGQRWQLFVSDNGTRVLARTKTSDDGGRVRVRKPTADQAGTDQIRASGVNVETGESCSGSVTH
jgi:hypothetical protein